MSSGASSPIRVLLVEDSPAQRALLVGVVRTDTRFVIAGTASSGLEAVAAAHRLRPDVIAMDIVLPGLDGYEAARQIMQSCPTRIVLVSSDLRAAQRTHDALAVGALTVVRKPGSLLTNAADRVQFLTTLRLMAGVPVVTRHRQRPGFVAPVAGEARPRVVAIAASTGGPLALQTILRGIGPDFPLPVLVVQHIAPGFTAPLVEWLADTIALPVTMAVDGAPLLPGQVYLAPDGRHLAVRMPGIVALRPAAARDRFCPSADVLFESVAAVYGRGALGVILTGMGDDGVAGLRALTAQGGTALAQDEASCVVYGMPRAAVAAGVVSRSVALDQLATVLRTLAGGDERRAADA